MTGKKGNYDFTATSSFEQYAGKDSPRWMLIVFGLAGIVMHTAFLARRRRHKAGVWRIAIPYAVFAGLVVMGILSK